MGYYTRHKLTVIGGTDCTINHEKKISELADYINCFDNDIKWYDNEEDMKEYSLQHPEIIFLIDGKGEESGDIWKAYFKKGKMFKTKAIMTFEEFNESKLV